MPCVKKTAMIDVFQWLKSTGYSKKPWFIFGKGPTFDRHVDFPYLENAYCTVSLNHSCRERPVLVAHMIDANVLDEIPNLEKQAQLLLMPWQPHFKFKPTQKTLGKLAEEHPTLNLFERQGRLLWYNLVSGATPRSGSPVVHISYFSAEAVVRILAMAGVKMIRTLGVDGGKSYGETFKDIKPFTGGHSAFDIQNKPIQKTVQEFKVDYGPLV